MKVSISRKAAESALDALRSRGTGPIEERAIAELQRALAPKPKSSQRKATERKRRDRQAETRSIYEQVEERGGGFCEMCGGPFVMFDGPEMDHAIPRRHGQSVASCWMIHAISCHRRKKTDAGEGARVWLEAFARHCEEHGYTAERKWAEGRLGGIVSMREASR